MTDLGKPDRQWEDVPIQEPTPGQAIPNVDDDPPEEPIEVPAEAPVEDPVHVTSRWTNSQPMFRPTALGW